MMRAGVDLGGTKIQTVVVDDSGTVVGEDRRPTPRTGGPDDVTLAIIASVKSASGYGHAQPLDFDSVGVGSPGQIDVDGGTVSHAGNLPGWSGTFPLGPLLAEQLGKPVTLGNDVQVGVQAEAEFGAGADLSSFLGVFVGTGVGGGVVQDGRLWRGRGAAGEIGHMVIELNGRLCPCGRRGCVEAYSGRAAMERTAREFQDEGQPTALFDIMERKGRPRLTSGVWAKALAYGDAVAEELIAEAVMALGAGIGSAVNLLDLEGVVIGGGLGIRLGQSFVGSIRDRAVTHMVLPERAPEFRLAALGDLGGAIGAAMLGRDRRSM